MSLTFGERVFWSIMILIFIVLVWLRFIEPYIPLWVAAVVGALEIFLFIRYGPKENGGEESGRGRTR